MKKTLILLLAFVLCFSLVACGGDDAETDEPAPEETVEETAGEGAEEEAVVEEEKEEVVEEEPVEVEEEEEVVSSGPEEILEEEILDYEYYVDIEKGITLYFDDIYVHERDGTQYLVVVSRFLNESETESFEPIDVLLIDASQHDEELEYVGGLDGISDDDGYVTDEGFATVQPGETSGPLYDIYILVDETPILLEYSTYDNYYDRDEYFYTYITDLPIK